MPPRSRGDVDNLTSSVEAVTWGGAVPFMSTCPGCAAGPGSKVPTGPGSARASEMPATSPAGRYREPGVGAAAAVVCRRRFSYVPETPAVSYGAPAVSYGAPAASYEVAAADRAGAASGSRLGLRAAARSDRRRPVGRADRHRQHPRSVTAPGAGCRPGRVSDRAGGTHQRHEALPGGVGRVLLAEPAAHLVLSGHLARLTPASGRS